MVLLPSGVSDKENDFSFPNEALVKMSKYSFRVIDSRFYLLSTLIIILEIKTNGKRQ
jgi:hypothetical protein